MPYIAENGSPCFSLADWAGENYWIYPSGHFKQDTDIEYKAILKIARKISTKRVEA